MVNAILLFGLRMSVINRNCYIKKQKQKNEITTKVLYTHNIFNHTNLQFVKNRQTVRKIKKLN